MNVACQIHILIVALMLDAVSSNRLSTHEEVAVREEKVLLRSESKYFSSSQHGVGKITLHTERKDVNSSSTTRQCCCRPGSCQSKHHHEAGYWQYRTGGWFGAYCCRYRDKCSMWGFSGKDPKDLGGIVPPNACSEPDCPDNMDKEYVNGKNVCICDKGYIGKADYVWNKTSWSQLKCDRAPCPEGAEWNSSVGHASGKCVCKEGYDGTIAWNDDSQKWYGKCSPVACPEGATGFPRCSCPKVGYKEALNWDAQRGSWQGACSTVHCPWPATGHPSCQCPAGYHGSLQWNSELEVYDGSCTPTWTRMTTKVSGKSCKDLGMEPIFDRTTCVQAGNALGVNHRGIAASSGSSSKPTGCYNQRDMLLLSRGSTGSNDARGWSPEVAQICKTKDSKPKCSWSVFDSSLVPKFNDIAQGQLGTCYFLAAAASIAHFHPHLIQNMMSVVEHHSHRLHVTDWFVNGHPVTVSVDEMIPVSKYGETIFVDYNHGKQFWPVILEKAWAKIFGSFKDVDRGFPEEAFLAMTQAPIQHYHVKACKSLNPDDDCYDIKRAWSRLLRCADEAFPAVAYTTTDPVSQGKANGIIRNHAFAVLDARVLASGEKVVQLFDPWGHNSYKGSLDSMKKADGSFYMTLAEFVTSFQALVVAEVRAGYKATSRVIEINRNSMEASLEFEMKDNAPFTLSVAWPNDRLISKGLQHICKEASPHLTLKVQFKPVVGKLRQYNDNAKVQTFDNAWLDIPGGAGKYTVNIYVNFVDVTWIHKVHFFTYAKENPEFKLTSFKTTGEKPAPGTLTCQSQMDAVDGLDNLRRNSTNVRPLFDSNFPPEQESIAPNGAKCFDAANPKDGTDCRRFNNWKTFGELACWGTDSYVDFSKAGSTGKVGKVAKVAGGKQKISLLKDSKSWLTRVRSWFSGGSHRVSIGHLYFFISGAVMLGFAG